MLRTILLNKANSKRSVNKETTVDVQLMRNAPLAPLTPLMEDVSEMATYDSERGNCGNARVTVSVEVVASNVLFNNITEIVETKGRMRKNHTFEETMKKKSKTEDTTDSDDENFEYQCGTDIFNNHLIRSNTFKSVGPTERGAQFYNTIKDKLRDDNGKETDGMKYVSTDKQEVIKGQHIYRKDEIDSFGKAILTKMEEKDGWFGFTNKSCIPRERKVGKGKVQNRPINNKPSCAFVDLYPTRDMYWFPPKADKHFNRTENNWDYLMLYPSSATTDGIEFIEDGTGALMVTAYDDRVKTKTGKKAMKIYSVSMHGLSEGDFVNIYVNGEIFGNPMEVEEIYDSFTFGVALGKNRINTNWQSFPDNETEINGYRVDTATGLFVRKGDLRKPLFGDKADVSDEVTSLSYKKVNGGKECRYYVRIFSKIPNFKWVEGARDGITDDIIKEGQKSENGFESHASRLAFAQNAYNDAIGEIVFPDDIEFGKLRTNNGLPITDIYISFKKSNNGYREWYRDMDVNAENVEQSHAFGKVNCGFELSPMCRYEGKYSNVEKMHNLEGGAVGLDMTLINPEHADSGMDDDEVIYSPIGGYDGDHHFYGDLCCFSESTFDETEIQQVCYRFNTAQREVPEEWGSYDYLKTLEYQELVSDDYDYKFNVDDKTVDRVMCQMANGYYYEPHKRIPIRTLSSEYAVDYGKKFHAKRFEEYSQGTYDVWTYANNFMEKGKMFHIFDQTTKETMMMEATEILTVRKFRAVPCDPNDKFLETEHDIRDIVVIKPDTDVLPNNFVIFTDGEVRYAWRNVIQNGYDAMSDLEWYPFTNGAFYISENVRIYLKRQDIDEFPDFVYVAKSVDDEKRENGYVIHTDIIC